MRKVFSYRPNNYNAFKAKSLQWAQQFTEVVWLDSNAHTQNYSSYDAILAVDAKATLVSTCTNAFGELQHFREQINDWLFGYLTYDLKNDIEAITSENSDGVECPDLMFFQPKKLFLFKYNTVELHYISNETNVFSEDITAINAITTPTKHVTQQPLTLKPRLTKPQYLARVNHMLQHIQRGDIYEANFCQEFYAENATISPLQTYTRLNALSQPPFAAFLKFKHWFALSASPERYLKKIGQTLISQPIKGTAKRSKNLAEDKALAYNLSNDNKERSENVMIVDLVRNDLSKTATKGSVKVAELCNVYSFLQVHQMISTITSTVNTSVTLKDLLTTTFPMGSMTGAPKLSAMSIIERLEQTKRGLYSGSIGYITPQGDFDFNVVIRSILYNQNTKYLSYSVGSAITAKSNPEQEYEECLIKAKAMRQALENA